MGQYLERKEKYGLEINDIVAIMTDLLIAGVDTTATAHYFLLYELGKNLEVQQELYEEIKRIVGDNRIVNEDHLEKLKFLKNCVKESLR
jgi:cytochrome P450